jgi:predicted nucleic acid-binding Zn ribbon protein
MPTADYKDQLTEEVFEMFFNKHPIPETVENPNTGNLSKRIYSGNVGFEFKGTGFYATDYKGK